uniref:Phenylalanyl-tRNA synthetase alpha chain family protein n=2 Tax=Rhizophora mucronata TaxID=61149 RepID=A0A2P2KN67_RHIMU
MKRMELASWRSMENGLASSFRSALYPVFTFFLFHYRIGLFLGGLHKINSSRFQSYIFSFSFIILLSCNIVLVIGRYQVLEKMRSIL